MAALMLSAASDISNNNKAVALNKLENLQFMMMAKKNKKHSEAPSDLSLAQLDQESSESEQEKTKDEEDVAAVDDLMKKYDQVEKTQNENEEFVNVLKKDEKLLNFFVENYSPGNDYNDDQKYISYVFSKYSEQGWSEDGKPLGKQVLGKKKARTFAENIVQKWKGYDLEFEAKEKQKRTDAFLNAKFEKAWKKIDPSKAQTGMIDMMEAHEFIKAIIPKAEVQKSETE